MADDIVVNKAIYHRYDGEWFEVMDRYTRRLLTTEEKAMLDEIERLLALVADYENSICWETTCTNCAKLLDANYDQYCEIKRLRAERDAIDALHQPVSRWNVICAADGMPWPCQTAELLHPEEARRER